MELDITDFFKTCTPFELSASQAEMGAQAGRLTWQNSMKAAETTQLLNSEDAREAFKAFVRSSGGWTQPEIDAWTEQQLNALFLQWIAGDMRQLGIEDGSADIDWTAIGERQKEGSAPSNIFLGSDERVYFYLGV